MSDFADDFEEYVNKHFPKGVNVPTNGSEDDAIRKVQEQFATAGFQCPESTARQIVHEAWRRKAG
jgi:hypothetical protein